MWHRENADGALPGRQWFVEWPRALALSLAALAVAGAGATESVSVLPSSPAGEPHVEVSDSPKHLRGTSCLRKLEADDSSYGGMHDAAEPAPYPSKESCESCAAKRHEEQIAKQTRGEPQRTAPVWVWGAAAVAPGVAGLVGSPIWRYLRWRSRHSSWIADRARPAFAPSPQEYEQAEAAATVDRCA